MLAATHYNQHFNVYDTLLHKGLQSRKNMEGLWDTEMIGYNSKPLDVKNAFQAKFKGHDLS